MTTALYRRYRPDTFEDVIGQEHVTEPLISALTKERISHAYLFSGPRGCGKTTSARILARCLNCAQGPTPHPCGECDSCHELATGGPGSLDVIEIDAASHGGVDDARDLRERATFAPVRDRYKVFIIDEAHMVTSAGFNALLKIVEEPPGHIKFIFATTEPDKVIGTIRSRTHHYPFRLVPPEPLMDYLERLCAQESVPVEPGVLSLVVRAGGGSVRDTLSVLDQLIAGAAEDGIGYSLAVNLLGFTPDALLDDVVDAVAAGDPAAVFRVVDRVVQSGQDPRRFVEDLLERFRDLVIVKAMPDSASSVLHGVPEDQIRRLETQAAQLGPAEISRAADITSAALTEMVGATSPRLHLELLMARLMLPTTDATERGLAARLDRIERRLAYGGVPEGSEADGGIRSAASPPVGGAPGSSPGVTGEPGQAEPSGAQQPGLSGAALARAAMRGEAAPEPAPPRPAEPGAPDVPPAAVSGLAEEEQQDQADQHPAAAEPVPASQRPEEPADRDAGVPEHEVPQPESAPEQSAETPRAAAGPAPSPDWGGGWAAMTEPEPEPEPARPQPAEPESARPEPVPSAQPEQPDRPAQQGPAEQPGQPDRPELRSQVGAPSGSQVEMIRRAWPEILGQIEEQSRLIWILVSQNASVAGFDGQLLTISFSGDGPRSSLQQRGGEQVLQQAVNAVLGITPQLDLITGGSAPAGGPSPKDEGRPAAPRPRTAPPSAPAPTAEPLDVSEERGDDEPEGASPGSEPVEEAATGPGTEPEPPDAEDLRADEVPLADPAFGIPVFARPEAELRAEFEARFGAGQRGARTEPSPAEPPGPSGASGSASSSDDGASTPGPRPGGARPEPGAMARPAGRPADQSLAEAPENVSSAAVAATATTGSPHQQRASRFQQMMEQYQQTGPGAPPAAPIPGGRRDRPADGDAGPGPETENGAGISQPWAAEVASNDDVTIEDSGLAGRAVVERLLGARLIEERSLDGSALS